MLITSSNNPLSTSDGHLPVSIFRYKDERRFLRVSGSYEETVQRVVNSFQIQPGQLVLLQTSSLTACQGRPVVIDSSAYPLLWSLLEEVEVVVATESVPEIDGAPRVDSDILAAVQEPQLTTTSRPTSPVAEPSRDGLGEQLWGIRRTPSPINASGDEIEWDEPEMPAETAQAPPQANPLFDWDDEPPSRIKQGEQAEIAPSTPQPKMKFKAVTPSTKSGPDITPMTKKDKQKATADVKLESLSNLDYLSKKTTRSVMDDDSRFEVIIVGPDEDSPTQFKLRGKNSVRKVLIAACKNFEVDPNRAYLVHSLELEVDGEIQTHNFVCAPDDTMAMCGINADSKIFVKVNPDMEDDPADDSSD